MVQLIERTESFVVTGTNFFIAYAAPEEAESVNIISAQISNQRGSTEYVTALWIDVEKRDVYSTTYWGDGKTIKKREYVYDKLYIVKDSKLPGGTTLSVLDKNIYLKPRDAVIVKAGTDPLSESVVHLTVEERYPDSVDVSTFERYSEDELQDLFRKVGTNIIGAF